MARKWQLQEAKSKFSQVVDDALKHGPQIITRRGVETVVVVSYPDFMKTRKSKSKLSVFLKESSLAEIELTRDVDFTRDEGLL